MKQLRVVMGFTPSQVSTETMKVVVEVETGGTCADGYKKSETIGIAKSEDGSLSIFRSGIKDIFPYNVISAIHMSNDCKDLSLVLRDLADAYDKVREVIT